MKSLGDPISGAYELPVTSLRMSPRYEPADRMLVNPDVRHRVGDEVLLSRDLVNGTRKQSWEGLLEPPLGHGGCGN